MSRSVNPLGEIEERARALLGAKPALPVDLPAIARRLGLDVEPVELGADVSGVLVVNDDRGVIGFNRSQSRSRQRFTVAHEIGHYVLHRRDGDLFIDKSYQAVAFFRSEQSAHGDDKREREANAFAAALLMPASLVKAHAKNLQLFELGEDDGPITELATLFGVSTQAMTFRLINLGLL